MRETKYLNSLSTLFVVVLVVSNLIGGKVAEVWGLPFSAALIVFPVSYIIGDVLTEVYGYGVDRRVIWRGFAYNLFAVVIVAIAVRLPSASFYPDGKAYAAVFGQSWRLLTGSFVAYLVGGFLNSFILAKLKIWMEGEFLWVRTIASTVVAQFADSVLFSAIAFGGIFTVHDIIQLSFKEWGLKCLFEALATPVTYAVVRYLKRAEGIDTYDRGTNFNPFTT